MSRVILLSLAALGALVFAVPEAQAQSHANSSGGFVVSDKLDKVDFYKSRKRIQIIDTSPIVSDHRTAPEGPNNLIINLAPVQGQQGQTTVMTLGAPQGGAGFSPSNGQPAAAGPGQVVLNLDRLPQAGFQPYVGDLKSPTRGLPSGGFKNSLAGKMLPQSSSPQKNAKPQPAQANPLSSAAAPVFTYAKSKTSGAIGSGSEASASATLSGILLTKKLSGK